MQIPVTDLYSMDSFSTCFSDFISLFSTTFTTWTFLSFLYKETHLRWTGPLANTPTYPGDNAEHYFLGETTERTLALGVTSGISFSRCAGLTQQRCWNSGEGADFCFPMAFSPCEPDTTGMAWRLLPQLQKLQLNKHSEVTRSVT